MALTCPTIVRSPKEIPILALAGLRIELETWFRNVAQGFKVDTKPFDSMNRVLARLRDANAVTPDQVMLARRVLNFCNQAIHGGGGIKEQALDVIGAASVLARDYLAWLSWGFDDNWTPQRLVERGFRGCSRILRQSIPEQHLDIGLISQTFLGR